MRLCVSVSVCVVHMCTQQTEKKALILLLYNCVCMYVCVIHMCPQQTEATDCPAL